MARKRTELTKLLQRTSVVLLVLITVCRATPSEFLVGGDISALTKIEHAGGVFRDEGKPGDAIGIMSDYGCNCFRLRLFVNPAGSNVVVNDLAYTIALAKRIKAAGARLLLNFHYSDTWADPGHQSKPRAWEDLDFESIPVSGLRIWYGGANAMFDSDGNALPSMNALQEVGGKPKRKIDFSQLTSPIIFRGDHKYGFRDPAVVYHDGTFHLYFTLSETAADGGYYNMTAYSRRNRGEPTRGS